MPEQQRLGAITVSGVDKDHFKKFYPALKWHFDSFAERSRGEFTAEGLVAEIMAERKQCWVASDGEVRACALTQVKDDGIRVVEVTQMAGVGVADWFDAVADEITRWARHIGAKRIRTFGRTGYTQRLRARGFRETHRIMEIDL